MLKKTWRKIVLKKRRYLPRCYSDRGEQGTVVNWTCHLKKTASFLRNSLLNFLCITITSWSARHCPVYTVLLPPFTRAWSKMMISKNSVIFKPSYMLSPGYPGVPQKKISQFGPAGSFVSYRTYKALYYIDRAYYG